MNLRILIFSILMTVVSCAAHYYLWRRLVKGAALPSLWHKTLSFLLVGLLVTIPVVSILARQTPRETLAPLALVAFTWMGLFSTYFVLTSFGDLVRAIGQLIPARGGDDDVDDPKKRALFGRVFAGTIAGAGTTLGAASVINQARGFKLVEVEVTLDKLPKAFDGFRIVQVSDVHVGPTIGADFVREIVDTSNSLQPDLVALTGDFVDGQVRHLARHTEPFGDLQARFGTFFVTGNHEYYSGADDWIQELSRLGIPTLRNASKRLEKDGQSLLVAGVTDYRAGGYGDGPDLEAALVGRRDDEEVVLLAHQPREIHSAQKHDVGLQLSGHTHGGQFWPWNWVVHLVQPVVSGLARFGRTQIYVNSGTGYWGPPMRMGTRSEITLLTLRASA